MGRLTTRVAQLEDENERRVLREYTLYALLAGAVSLFTLLFARR